MSNPIQRPTVMPPHDIKEVWEYLQFLKDEKIRIKEQIKTYQEIFDTAMKDYLRSF